MARKWLGILMILSLMTVTATAQDIHTQQQLTKKIMQMRERFTEIMTVQSLTKSPAGHDIWLLTLGTPEAQTHPAVLYIAGLEGPDLTSTEIALRVIETWAENLQSNPALLDSVTFYWIPRLNPDAAMAYFAVPQSESFINGHAYDDDRDARIDEDGHDDLDGDGLITWMLIEDPAGEWMADSLYPEIMRKADKEKGETGRYKLLPEGKDNDKDGKIDEDPVGGVDLNKNFTYDYPFFAKHSGLFQMSEPESKAVADFVFSHANIFMVYSFSRHHNLIEPWKAEKNEHAGEPDRDVKKDLKLVPAADASYYRYMTRLYQDALNPENAPEAEFGQGALPEWAYFHTGRFSVAAPAWWPPQVSKDSVKTEDNDLQQKRRWIQYSRHIGDGFTAWKSIEHEDFPGRTVRMGGFHPFFGFVPPADSLDALAEKHESLLSQFVDLRPQLQWDHVRAVSLGENVYRIEAVLHNSGFLPTASEIGSRMKWVPKIRVSIELPSGGRLISGQERLTLDRLEGFSSHDKIEWVLQTRQNDLRLLAESPAAGRAEYLLELKND
jgi:hypothetical protein